MFSLLLFRRPAAACAALLAAVLAFGAGCATGPGHEDDREGFSPVRDADEERSTFRLDEGLRIELVAAEPLIEDPVVITFDAAGRLWVVEMRGFMPRIAEASDQTPTGRIKVLTDTDGDGQMDQAVVFMDSLVLPRALALVPGGVLVAENKPLWMVYDDDGDLKADRKVLIDSTYGGSGLPEHAGNGLWRGIDNWYYNAKSRIRYRLEDDSWVRDTTEFRGQWGISHDDTGRLFYNYNWSQLHTDLVPPNALSRNPHHVPTSGLNVGVAQDRRIFPIRTTLAVNRGYIPGALDERGRLLEFTSASAPLIYRGDALPEAYRGNAFVCEPAGNLIKRNIVEYDGLNVTAYSATPEREFLASTDERFRPVFLTTGPDGALYIADMYRGIIQDGVYMTPYLREQTEQRRLEAPIHHGRIWRVVPEFWTPPGPLGLDSASSRTLVALLSDQDGWVRDTAQRLLVERADPDIVPFLERVALREIDRRGRLHALWTLEGLDALSRPVLEKAIQDRDPDVQAAAIRLFAAQASRDPSLSEPLADALTSGWAKAPPVVALQMALSADVLEADAALPLLAGILGVYREDAVFRDAVLSSLTDREFALLDRLWTSWEWRTYAPGRAILMEMLATAALRRGDPDEIDAMMGWLGDDEFGWRQEALLAGLTVPLPAGPTPLRSAPAVLDRLASLGPGVAGRLAAIEARFSWPGHTPPRPEPTSDGASLAIDPAQLAAGRQHFLTVCAACHGNDGAGMPSLAPPLAGSEWVTGSKAALIRIVLHGLEGPVDVAGRRYDAPDILPEMPSFATLDDAAIAAVLTYLRTSWGNAAEPVSTRDVGMTRVTSQGRVTPWTANELGDLEEPDANRP